MKFLAVLYLVCSPLASEASPLGDLFSTYVKVRQAEEGLRLDPSPQEQQKFSAALSQARIEFNEVMPTENLSPWEANLAKKAEAKVFPQKKFKANPGDDAKSLEFLRATFAKAKELSPLEWQSIQEWFGASAQQTFLKETYAFAELPSQTAEPAHLVWVKDPYHKLLPQKEALVKADLASASPELTTIELTAFPEVENQAEELRHAILGLGEKNFVIVSEGDASAVVLKMLDLYPGLRERENIQGWVNVNGRLYGQGEKAVGRALASVPTAADQFSRETLRDHRRLRHDALVRGAPLGEGFPIVNIISWEKNRRPAENLREAIVAEGTSWIVSQGPAAKKIRAAFPLLAPAR